jgi:hypothetical protein
LILNRTEPFLKKKSLAMQQMNLGLIKYEIEIHKKPYLMANTQSVLYGQD